MTPAPKHSHQFAQNLAHVARLAEIHSELTGEGPGRRTDVDILNKSGIVLVVACWESFVEDLAVAGFDHLLSNAKSASAFPHKVLTLASKPLTEDRDERRVWDLADDGWRAVLKQHRDSMFERFLGGFHTPRPGKVDDLFEGLLGLSQLSRQWSWRRNPNQTVLKQLEALITLRGDIAHRVAVGRYVKKQEVTDAVDLVRGLAAVSANRIRDHLIARTTMDPWPSVSYGSAK